MAVSESLARKLQIRANVLPAMLMEMIPVICGFAKRVFTILVLDRQVPAGSRRFPLPTGCYLLLPLPPSTGD